MEVVAFLLLLAEVTTAFNLDTRHAEVLEGPPHSYFGYSVALRGLPGPIHSSIVVGAPRANSSFLEDEIFVETGEVYEFTRNQNSWSRHSVHFRPDDFTSSTSDHIYNLGRNHSGYGAAIDAQTTSDAPLVVCEPGIKNTYEDNCYLNGICYVSTKHSDKPSVMLPLTSNSKQLSSISHPYYAYGEVGMSVHLSKHSSELLIGAPGVMAWTGTVIKYAQLDGSSINVLVPDTPGKTGLQYYDYFGFSVSSGKFFSSETLFVSGAPRSANLSGRVLVFNYVQKSIKVLLTLEGHQMGEYFGWTLCVLDLNADGRDDLVVGAPHHSLHGSTAGDEGRVFAYLSHADGTMEESKDTVITGSSYPYANFGTAIASIGDINMDGYQDLAVGAPYEGNGAIYIYHGSKDGMRPRFAQRISATDVTSQVLLSSFGFSISSGLDIDGNQYNDIVVGAYSSAHAVVLRSRPVVHLHANLKSHVIMISLNDLTFRFTACVFYSGHFLPNQLGITATLKVDRDLNRAIINGWMNIFSYNATVANKKEDCRNFSVTIKDGVGDFSNPINISLDLSLQDALLAAGTSARGEFCQSCPVADPEDNGAVMSVFFDNGCGKDAVCQTDLAVDIRFVNVSEPFILNPETPLKLAVSVESSKEPAYQSRFTFETSGEVSLAKLPSSCQQIPDTSVLRLECTLGQKPLTNVTPPVMLEIELGVSKVSAHTREIVFNVTAESSGLEQTPSNNIALLHLQVFTDSQPVLIGRSKPATVYFREQSDDVMTFAHVYEVRTSGPSPMADVDLEVLVPTTAVVEGKTAEVLHIDGVSGQLGSRLLNCTSRQGTATDVTTEGSTNTTLQLSCKHQSTSCVVVTCRGFGPFPTTRTAAVVSIRLRALPTALYSALGKKKFIHFSTMGKAIYTLPQNSIYRNKSSHWQEVVEATAGATSELIADIAAEKVEPWILLLAILAGLLILLLFILAMYKAGFFNRKRRDYNQLHEGTVTNDDENVGPTAEESTRLSHN